MIRSVLHSLLALCLGLALITAIVPIKGGALQWVALAWVGACALALAIVLAFSPKANFIAADSCPQNKPGLLLFAYLFITFQTWTLLQALFIAPDKAVSLNQSIIGFGMVCLLGLWFYAVRHPKALRALYLCLMLLSVAQAAYGLWIYLSGINLLLWMPKLYYLDRPTGFFVNANHFAAYLLMGIILCSSNIVSTRHRTGSQSRLLRWFDLLYSPSVAILGLLLVALFASKSLGAMASFAVVLSLIVIKISWRSRYYKTMLVGTVVFTAICILFILSIDYSLVEDQLANISHTVSRRYALSEAAFTMLKDNWLLGVGGGAFYSQFSPYRTLEIGNSFYYYAHNDFLQFWIEYGLVGVLILILFIARVMRDNIRVLSMSAFGMQATFARASIYTTIAVAIHSLVDFPLHIPGFSVCYIILISINSLCLAAGRQMKRTHARKPLNSG